MDSKKKRAASGSTGAHQDIKKVDSAANIPYASEESVEEARNWGNEHEL